jgi:hypothetical protein
MRHLVNAFIIFFAATTLPGCGSDNNNPIDPSPITPIAITESFSGNLNVNGARTHSFAVDRAGTVTATVKTLSNSAATLGVSLGTWNGVACAIIISNTAAILNTTVTGTATSSGQFCVWLNDVGKLTAGVDYSIDVTHY